jgi:hypothetical protein
VQLPVLRIDSSSSTSSNTRILPLLRTSTAVSDEPLGECDGSADRNRADNKNADRIGSAPAVKSRWRINLGDEAVVESAVDQRDTSRCSTAAFPS